MKEVEGRIEAVARLALELTARMEDEGIIIGPLFSEQLRRSVRPEEGSPAHLEIARQRLCELADALDAARDQRESSQPESRHD